MNYDPREELHLLKAQLQSLKEDDAHGVLSVYSAVRGLIQNLRRQSHFQAQLETLPASMASESISSDLVQCRTDMLFSLSLCQHVIENNLPS